MSPDTLVLTDPDAFFRERRDDPSIKWPALIVLLSGVLGVVGAIPMFLAMSSAFEGTIGTVVAVFQLGGSLFGLVAVFIVWFIYAGMFHVISLVFDGEGEFRDTFALTGYGYVPKVFSSLLGAAINFYLWWGVSIPNDPERMGQFVRSMQNDPMLLVAGLLGIVFTLWSGFIWMFAVKHARTLELREAALTVALPVLAGIGWSAFSLLQFL